MAGRPACLRPTAGLLVNPRPILDLFQRFVLGLCLFYGFLTWLTASSHFIVIISSWYGLWSRYGHRGSSWAHHQLLLLPLFFIISHSLVSDNKPPSVVSVRMAFTQNLPTHFILTAFTSFIIFFVGQLPIIIIIIITRASTLKWHWNKTNWSQSAKNVFQFHFWFISHVWLAA